MKFAHSFSFFSKINSEAVIVHCYFSLCIFSCFVKHFITDFLVKRHQLFMAEEFSGSCPRIDLLSVSFMIILSRDIMDITLRK